jgi:hypothetical protein
MTQKCQIARNKAKTNRNKTLSHVEEYQIVEEKEE